MVETLSKLGYVQLDSIRNVARAHHHILWSRNQSYRPPDLERFAHQNRGAFEHFGHDACLLPIKTYPMWARRFRQFRDTLIASKGFARIPDAAERTKIRNRIAEDGPLCSADFTHEKPVTPRAMWERPPTKLALDYMWYVGELSTAYRKGFRKYYDLTERVIPADLRNTEVSEAAQIDWLCRGALERLGFATPGEIKRFWDACNTTEVRDWIAENRGDLVEVEIEAADGSCRHAFALGDIEERIGRLRAPTSRLRILNPFDPAVRDRKRLFHLFGFEYINEIFVPRAKRRWGYYVYPVLQYDRMIGRVDLSGGPKLTPDNPICPIRQQWAEPGVEWTARRQAKLDAEVARLSRLAR